MPFLNFISHDDRERGFDLLTGIARVRTHFDLINWLHGDMQFYLPHDVLIASWGDFRSGDLQYDIVSAIPSVRTSTIADDSLNGYMQQLFLRWLGAQKSAFVADAPVLPRFVTDRAGTATRVEPPVLRSALVHGLHDRRSGHDYLYVVLGRSLQDERRSRECLTAMLPYIDAAFRCAAPLPKRCESSPVTANRGASIRSVMAPQIAVPRTSHQTTGEVGMTDRELQIMGWVEMGKTNHEIGAILDISAFTVKNHLQRIFKKLDVYNRAQAVSRFKDTHYSSHG